jgi:hypothetical protein
MSDTPKTDKLAGDWIACETVPASHARELERENARLREECDQKTAWINEMFRRMGLPSGDMGALENYILSNARDHGLLPGARVANKGDSE